jgi:putative transposase
MASVMAWSKSIPWETFPKRIKVYNRSEFISKLLYKWPYDNNVELDFSGPVKSTDNQFIGSFNRSFGNERLSGN